MSELNVRKRGQKWQYEFEIARIDGKRKQKTKSGFKTKKEALEAGAIALAEYNNSGLTFEPTKISVSDFYDYWFENYVKINLQPNTQDSYKNYIDNHIKPSLGYYKLSSITSAILQDFINKKMINGFSKNHLKNLLGFLSGSFKYAVEPGHFIKSSPMIYVKMPRYELSTIEINRRILSEDEFSTIINRFPFGNIFYIPLMIGYYTGLRIGETLALTWDDIDFENNTISVNKNLYFDRTTKKWNFGPTKTPKSNRTIPFGNTLAKELKKHKNQQTKNRLKYGNLYYYTYEKIYKVNNKCIRELYFIQAIAEPKNLKKHYMVCTKEDGELVTINTLKYASRVINYTLKIPFNFHCLRHTHATMLIENGDMAVSVQARLGHSRIETTYNTYVHHTKKMSENSVEIFEKAANQNKSH